MPGREWWTSTLPLNDSRDLLARVGFRFLWATAPYFALVYLIESLTSFTARKPVRHFLAVFMFLLPILGGILDWWRLRRRVGPVLTGSRSPSNGSN